MAIGDTWRRALEYFGLVDGDYIEEGEYTDEHDVRGPSTEDIAAPREPSRAAAPTRSRGGGEDIDDIFGDDEPPPRRRAAGRSAGPATPPPDMAPAGGNGADVQMNLVNPRSFNDAQQVADHFKNSRPVILNLQDTNTDLARRLIDFCSGLTYALGGGMQKIANQTFLLTPANVNVSAAEAERMLESGFFNQS
jgi:cell division inhibitor SepF